MNKKINMARKFLEDYLFRFELAPSEVMIVWSLRHWTDCISSGDNPRELFSLCTEEHELPDISFLFDEISLAIANGSVEKGVIGCENCDHMHYGEFKILEALYFLQNDKLANAIRSLSTWLRPEESRTVFKLATSLSLILEKANLIIPQRNEFLSDWMPH